MNSWARRIEFLTNLFVLFAFLCLSVLLARRVLQPDGSNASLKVGQRISIAGASLSDKNLVLVLSTTCHFCSESALFYQRLVPMAKNARVPVIAVFPQTQTEGSSYLARLGVSDVAVAQGSLSSMHTSGTPTILIVDGIGKISRFWVGKLDADNEDKVLSAL